MPCPSADDECDLLLARIRELANTFAGNSLTDEARAKAIQDSYSLQASLHDFIQSGGPVAHEMLAAAAGSSELLRAGLLVLWSPRERSVVAARAAGVLRT